MISTENRFSMIEIGDTPSKPQTPNSEVFKPVGGLQVNGSVGKDKNGTWHNAIGLESSDTHRHVAKIWQEQCIPFPTFRAAVESDHLTKRDLVVPESSVRLDGNLRLPDGTEFTEYGLSTLGKFTDIKSGTIEDLVSHDYRTLAATVINTELDKRELDWDDKGKRPRDFIVRLRKEGDKEVARFVGSERYGKVDNRDVVRILADALPTHALADVLASHIWDNGDDMFGNLLIPDYMKQDVDSEYGVGIAFRNSEVGKHIFRIDPFLFRAICLNGIIWGRQNSNLTINIKHAGHIDFFEIASQAKRVVANALSLGNDLLTQMGYTRDIEVPNVEATIVTLAQRNKLTNAQGRAWLDGYNTEIREKADEKTGFAIVQGLTRGAQKFNGERRIEMETAAGNILTPSLVASPEKVKKTWQDYVAAANLMDKETVQQYLYVRG